MIFNNSEKFTLLDYICQKASCLYLSDLHYAPNWLLYRIISKVPTEACSLEEWKDTLTYLSIPRKKPDTDHDFSSAEEIRKQLLSLLAS